MSANEKLVDVERMKSKFLAFVDAVVDPLNFQMSKIEELSSVDSILRRASKKFQSKVTKIDKID